MLREILARRCGCRVWIWRRWRRKSPGETSVRGRWRTGRTAQGNAWTVRIDVDRRTPGFALVVFQSEAEEALPEGMAEEGDDEPTAEIVQFDPTDPRIKAARPRWRVGDGEVVSLRPRPGAPARASGAVDERLRPEAGPTFDEITHHDVAAFEIDAETPENTVPSIDVRPTLARPAPPVPAERDAAPGALAPPALGGRRDRRCQLGRALALLGGGEVVGSRLANLAAPADADASSPLERVQRASAAAMEAGEAVLPWTFQLAGGDTLASRRGCDGRPPDGRACV